MSIQTSNKYFRENLVVFYRFQEPSNSPRIDYANNLTASDNNTVATGTGPSVNIPTCCTFVSANSEYLNVPFTNYIDRLRPVRNLFISVWFRFTTLTGSPLSIYDFVSPSNSTYVIRYSGGATKIIFEYRVGSTQKAVATSETPTTGVWYHLTAWHESGVGSGLRLNAGSPQLLSDTAVPINTMNRDFIIGGGRTGGNTSVADLLNGLVAQPMVWHPTNDQLQYLKGPGTVELYNNGNGLAL